MTAKQKAIREAWIEIVGADNFDKLSFDEEGFSSWRCRHLFDRSKDYLIYDKLKQSSNPNSGGESLLYRPKSLINLETNNGWTRIESVEQIQEHADCGTEHIAACHIENKTFDFLTGKQLVKLYKTGAVTHYEKPKLRKMPIY